jgi:hypothetical protein
VTDDTPPIAMPVDLDEEAAWADLGRQWGDPLAHRAFLARCLDLEALARAGARYRAVLEATPDDPVAAAGRDEVLRRATVLGLAAMPRTAPAAPASPWLKRALLAALVVLGIAVVAWIALVLLRPGSVR